MKILKLAAVIASLLLSSCVWAASPITGILETAKCGRSTAILFVESGKLYAIGSEAASSCSEAKGAGEATVVLADGRKHEIEAIRPDWGTGLALLDLGKLAPEDGELAGAALPKATVSVKPGTALQLLTADHAYRARVISNRSDRHAFPLITETLETLGDPLPFSAIGAPALLPDGSWAGVVSSQALELVPGSPTQLTERHPAGPSEKHNVLIPTDQVDSWVTAMLNGTYESPYLKLAEGKVQTGSLVFTEDCPAPEQDSKKTGEYPIGGGDGVGIGGSYTVARICKLKVERAQAEGKAPSFAYPRLKQWHDLLAAALSQGKQVELWYLLKRDETTGILDRWTTGSNHEFFRDLQNPSLNPAAIVTDPVSGQFGADPARQSLRDSGSEIIRLALGRWKGMAPLTYMGNSLLGRLYFVGKVLQSEAYSQLTVQDLRTLADPNGVDHQAWLEVKWMSPEGEQLPAAIAKAADVLSRSK